MKPLLPLAALLLVACAADGTGAGVSGEPDAVAASDVVAPSDTGEPAADDAVAPEPDTAAPTPDDAVVPDPKDVVEAPDPGPGAEDVPAVAFPDVSDVEDTFVDAGAAPDITDGAPCPPEGPYGNTVGDTAPNLVLLDCDGNEWSLHDLCGKGAWLFGYAHW